MKKQHLLRNFNLNERKHINDLEGKNDCLYELLVQMWKAYPVCWAQFKLPVLTIKALYDLGYKYPLLP